MSPVDVLVSFRCILVLHWFQIQLVRISIPELHAQTFITWGLLSASRITLGLIFFILILVCLWPKQLPILFHLPLFEVFSYAFHLGLSRLTLNFILEMIASWIRLLLQILLAESHGIIHHNLIIINMIELSFLRGAIAHHLRHLIRNRLVLLILYEHKILLLFLVVCQVFRLVLVSTASEIIIIIVLDVADVQDPVFDV